MIIVEPIFKETIGLIYIPKTAQRYNAEFQGVVKSVGPEYKDGLKVGDKVAFVRHEGVGIRDKYLALKSAWVVGKVLE